MPELLFAKVCAEISEDMPELKISDEMLSAAEGEALEINTDATLTEEDGRMEFSYDESEITGMAGSKTAISFAEDNPSLVTMIRSGSVSTSLVFEQGKRHHCVYKTPYCLGSF